MNVKSLNNNRFLAALFFLWLLFSSCVHQFVQMHKNDYPHPFEYVFTDTVNQSEPVLFDRAYAWAKGEFTSRRPIFYDSISHWKFYKQDKSLIEAIESSNKEKGEIDAKGFIVDPVMGAFGRTIGADYISYKMAIIIKDGTYSVKAYDFVHWGDPDYEINVSNPNFGSLDSVKVPYVIQLGKNREFYKVKKFTAEAIREKFNALTKEIHGENS